MISYNWLCLQSGWSITVASSKFTRLGKDGRRYLSSTRYLCIKPSDPVYKYWHNESLEMWHSTLTATIPAALDSPVFSSVWNFKNFQESLIYFKICDLHRWKRSSLRAKSWSSEKVTSETIWGLIDSYLYFHILYYIMCIIMCKQCYWHFSHKCCLRTIMSDEVIDILPHQWCIYIATFH